MPSSSDQSSVLVEQASPAHYPHIPETSSSQLPVLSNLISELESVTSPTSQQQTSTMDGDPQPTEPGLSTANGTDDPPNTQVEAVQVEEEGTESNAVAAEPSQEESNTSTTNAEPVPADESAEQTSPQTSNTNPSGEQAPVTEENTGENGETAPVTEDTQNTPSEYNTPQEADDTPAWVKFEEDTSVPDEEEMKEIEASEYDKLSALDIKAMEEQFYTDVEDPEQRPVKKLRLSWLIKGVRGTKERPNYARVLNSPGAYVDGLYWSIKFYPRGDNCSSLSAFVRCSRDPPPVDEECPESEFAFFEGPAESQFSVDMEPKAKISIVAKDRPKAEGKPAEEEQSETEEVKKQTESQSADESSNQASNVAEETSDASTEKPESKDLPNWRVSAQLGMGIYNPEEPRTGHLQSDGHQFSRHCDDWGWVNFVGPWDEIHKRKRGQRQALLRNDTLAIDAYIRIYEDPTEALWWHESKDENQWPSKELAGYFSMGTPGLYHSPAVAGLTSWLLLAPLRQILQSADGGQWRMDSKFNPRPLICQCQLVLDQMRNLSSDCYVNLYRIIEEFLEVDERWNDVKSFWEAFRRGLELELADEPEALKQLSSIFDADGSRWDIPNLSVSDSKSIQQGLSAHFEEIKFNGSLPDFLPVMLNRSEFDTKLREWKLHHDRVRLDDELDLSKWCNQEGSRFTLYGFVAHVGSRNSGKFYSVLRPGGMKTKWLAFEDGNGNKVFSYSRKRVQEYEGLEGDELRKFPVSQSRENAYLAMYIRTSCLQNYLSGSLEPYRVPKWLKPWADDPKEDDDVSQVHQEVVAQSPAESEKQDKDGVQIELYLDECAEGCEDMLRLHDLRTAPVATDMRRTVTVATDKTFKELRCAIAKAFEIDDHTKVQMWEIHYQGLGKFSRAILEPISHRRKVAKEAIPGQIFRLWISIQQPLGEAASYKHLLDRLNDLDLAQKTPEQDNILEDVDAERLAKMTEPTESEPTLVTESEPHVNEGDAAEPDVEQAAVQTAVETDLENVLPVQDAAHNEADVTVTPASAEQSESSEGEDGMLTPTSSAHSVAAVVEPGSNEEAETPSTESPPEQTHDETPPVVHGHPVDATQHTDVVADVEVTHTSAHIPHGDAAALEQVLSEDSITPTEVQQTEVVGDEAAGQAERESQNQTPTPVHVPRAYGNIQLFDTEHQRFVAQRPFHPELETEIGSAVRKQMGWDDQRQFRVWRRQGPTGTEVVGQDVTFSNAGLQDVFTLIVGDALSDNQIEDLKVAGKLWKPQQLISYLGMVNRKHPHAALTSTEPVELADYGADYYKGPLSRGRPHGEKGHSITATGHVYEGPFVAGQKSGAKGKMTYQNGDTYLGEWYNDERHGTGEFTERRTGNRYVGGFENGKRWGQGVTYWQVADQQAEMCQICYEEEIDALFYDCGHVCACVTCAKQCDTCPLCRRSVRQVVKMYRA